jgi:HEPN domain-containing protein
VEKYLKALLTYYEIDFPRQHDLEELLTLLLEKDSLLSFLRQQLKLLTPFAVNFRYPGENITDKEVKMAVKIMKQIRVVLRRRLGFKT